MTLTRTSGGDVENPGATIPESFYGTFEGEDGWTHHTAKVVISADGVTVTIDDGEPVVATDLVVTEEEYFGSKIWSATFKLNGNAYSMSEGYTADQISFSSDFDNQATFQATLTRTTQSGGDEESARDKINGTFAGEDAGVSYSIVITADGIVVGIDGVEKTVVIDSFDDYEGFTVTIDGEEYYIMNASYTDDSVPQVCFMSSDYRTVNVVLDRVA